MTFKSVTGIIGAMALGLSSIAAVPAYAAPMANPAAPLAITHARVGTASTGNTNLGGGGGDHCRTYCSGRDRDCRRRRGQGRQFRQPLIDRHYEGASRADRGAPLRVAISGEFHERGFVTGLAERHDEPVEVSAIACFAFDIRDQPLRRQRRKDPLIRS